MQRRSVWNVWLMVSVACVVLGACSEDSAEEQTADTSDTADTVEDTSPDCPSGARVDGVCAPLPPAKPEFVDWVCPAGWLSVPALATVSGEAIAIEGVAPWMRCEPPPFIEPPTECEPGLMPQYGQAACVAHGSPCPADGQDWADDATIKALAPDFAGRIWFVRAGEASGGTGTRGAPFGTLEAALRASNGGDMIALSKGEFAESFSVARPVAVVGACVARTTIRPPGTDDVVPSVAVSGSALLTNFTITGPRVGLQIDANDAPATAHDLLIRDAEQRGVLVNSGGKINLSHVWIDHTQSDAATQTLGDGLRAQADTIVEITASAFTRNHSVGLATEGQITLTDALITHTRVRPSDKSFGSGFTVLTDGDATLTRVAILDNFAFGLGAQNATITIKDVQVFRTQRHPDSVFFGQGLFLNGGQSDLEAITVAQNNWVGLEARGGTLNANGLRISDTKARVYESAPGIFLNGGVQAQIQGAALSGDGSTAVGVSNLFIEEAGEGPTRATIQDLWIAETTSTLSPRGPFTAGTALHVSSGAQATVSRAVLLNNPGAGVAVDGRNTILELSDAVVFGTHGDTVDGIEAIDATGVGFRIVTWPDDTGEGVVEAILRRVHFSQNQNYGVFAYGDVEVAMEDTAITDTQRRQISPDTQPQDGVGMLIEGSRAELTRVKIARNSGVGLGLIEASVLNASDIVISGTRPSFDQRFGHGLEVVGSAAATMERVVLEGNARAGAIITNDGTLALSDARVSGDNAESCPQCEDGFGDGIVSQLQAGLTMERFKITDCPRVGLLIASDKVSARDGLITENLIGLHIKAEGVDVASALQNVLLTGNNVDQDFSEITLPSVSDAAENAGELVNAPAGP